MSASLQNEMLRNKMLHFAEKCSLPPCAILFMSNACAKNSSRHVGLARTWRLDRPRRLVIRLRDSTLEIPTKALLARPSRAPSRTKKSARAPEKAPRAHPGGPKSHPTFRAVGITSPKWNHAPAVVTIAGARHYWAVRTRSFTVQRFRVGFCCDERLEKSKPFGKNGAVSQLTIQSSIDKPQMTTDLFNTSSPKCH
jgi:hypothetical protein